MRISAFAQFCSIIALAVIKNNVGIKNQKSNGECGPHSSRLGELSDILFSSISRLQEPQDCTASKKLICSVNFHPLGFNNMLHMLVTCHMLAYGLGRVLVVTNLDFWSREGDLQEWFVPFLGSQCGFKRKLKIDDFAHVRSLNDPKVVRDFENVINDPENLKYEFDFGGIKAPFPYPPGVCDNTGLMSQSYLWDHELDTVSSKGIIGVMPKKLKDAVKKYHRHPVHWYIGHFLKYHLRPNANFSDLLNNIKKNIGFKHPIVGIHVRQGDKIGDEMNFIPEDDFIMKARHYFIAKDIPPHERRVFVATDTAGVVKYLKETYSNEFHFIHVASVDRDGAGAYFKKHYQGSHLTSLLVEMMLLIECDYNVVTFSSYVGKVIYLAKQGLLKTDATDRVTSLDRKWFFTFPGYQYGPEFLRYCLFIRNGRSLDVSPKVDFFHYNAGDYGRTHSREKVLQIGNRTEKVVFVTHDKTKIIGVVLSRDTIPYPRQPSFADDFAFESL